MGGESFALQSDSKRVRFLQLSHSEGLSRTLYQSNDIMVGSGWEGYSQHALTAAVVFEFMHIADELAGNWAPFQPFNDPMVATFGLGIFTLWAIAAMWGVTSGRTLGYALAAAFGLFFLVVECWHYFDPSNMTPFRWLILLFAQASEAGILIIGGSVLRR